MLHNANLYLPLYMMISLISLINKTLMPELKAQSSDFLADRASREIKTLAHGSILVRLAHKQNKIKATEEQLAKKNISQKARAEWMALKVQTIKERDLKEKNLKIAFSKYYSFSKVLFYQDDEHHLLSDPNAMFLTDVNGVIQKTPQDSFLILAIGKVTDNGTEAFIVLDSSGSPLTKPFPYLFRSAPTAALFYDIIYCKSSAEKKTEIVIKKIQKRFQKYYQSQNN